MQHLAGFLLLLIPVLQLALQPEAAQSGPFLVVRDDDGVDGVSGSDCKMPKRYRIVDRSTKRIEIGARLQDDRLLENQSQNHQYPNRQDEASLQISYPHSNLAIGYLLTYVELLVYTETEQQPESKLYRIVSGGLRQREMTIELRATNTCFLNYNVTFYGL